MKTLITGATGFLGSHIQGIPLKSNIENRISLRDEIISKSEGDKYVVVHCAAMTDVEECERNKKAFDINVKGTQNVLEAIDPERGKFILLSSCHVFSGNKYYSYSEKDSPDPVNVYGYTKYGAEALTALYPLQTLVVRIGKIYSDDLIDRVLEMREAVPGFIKRNFIHINDFVKVMDRIIPLVGGDVRFPKYKKLYDVLHVGSPAQNYTYHLFYNLIRDHHGMDKLPKRSMEYKTMTPRPYRCGLNVRHMEKYTKGIEFRAL